MAEWMTTAEAAEALGVSERQVRNKVKSGKLKAKKQGNRWLIDRSLTEAETEMQDTDSEVSELPTEIAASAELLSRLEADNEWLRHRVDQFGTELAETRKAGEEANQRHDTIVLQLTRQLEQSQRLLAYRQSPWWRRWFSRSKVKRGSKTDEGRSERKKSRLLV